jgi:hypothetical protein
MRGWYSASLVVAVEGLNETFFIAQCVDGGPLDDLTIGSVDADRRVPHDE